MGGLASSAVVGLLDPGHDRQAELVAGLPTLAVEDVLLQECEERLHGGLSLQAPTRPIEPRRPAFLRAWTYLRERNWLPRSECTVVAAGSRRQTALRNAATASEDFIRESIE